MTTTCARVVRVMATLDEAGGVIRLSPARSKTLVGRILPISQPIAEALVRRRARRDPDSPLVSVTSERTRI